MIWRLSLYCPVGNANFQCRGHQGVFGQNRALRIGDWRVLIRVGRGKNIELTVFVDPTKYDLLKSLGHILCYGFGSVHVSQGSRHSVEVNESTAASNPETALTAQTPAIIQESTTCSNSSAPNSNTSEEQTSDAAGSKMVSPSTRLPLGCALLSMVDSPLSLASTQGDPKRKLCF
ncbi:hypothetical protein ACLKA7_001446 [Drosophila subpalustris]